MDTVPFNWNNDPPTYKEIKYTDKDGNVTCTVYEFCCPNCGEVVRRSHKYCINCGIKLKEDRHA